jgi:hypothetical protein
MLCDVVPQNQKKSSRGNPGSRPSCVATLGGSYFGSHTMKKIPLTKGLSAIVDDADYEELSRHKWYAMKNTYGGFLARRSTFIDGKHGKVWMHRFLLGLKKGDNMVGDHINHNTLDNRRFNLRKCTQGQNLCNMSPNKNTSSQYKGVSFNKQCRKWDARISKNGVQHCLQLFETEELAALAYNEKAKELHGEFAHLNKIN